VLYAVEALYFTYGELRIGYERGIIR
jgi:hypothetical protein